MRWFRRLKGALLFFWHVRVMGRRYVWVGVPGSVRRKRIVFVGK